MERQKKIRNSLEFTKIYYWIPALIGAAVSIGLGITNKIISSKERKQDISMQKEQQGYDRSMQNTMMDREDNAVQRRVADLKGAGINPVLAAGQAAGSGIAYHSHSPNTGRTDELSLDTNLAGFLMNMAEQEQRIKNLSAQEKEILQRIDLNDKRDNREAAIHEKELTQRDYNILESRWRISVQDINTRALRLENDLRVQNLELGERKKLAVIYEIAMQDVRLSREAREEFIDSLFARTQRSPSGVLNILGDWINAGASNLAELANRIDEHFGNDFRVGTGRGSLSRILNQFEE